MLNIMLKGIFFSVIELCIMNVFLFYIFKSIDIKFCKDVVVFFFVNNKVVIFIVEFVS